MKTLTPSYGQDYKSAKAALAAYKSGKDFILWKGGELGNQQIAKTYAGKAYESAMPTGAAL